MPQVRFTAWISENERAGLERAAAQMNSSINFVVRTLLREGLERREMLPVLRITSDTPHEREVS